MNLSKEDTETLHELIETGLVVAVIDDGGDIRYFAVEHAPAGIPSLTVEEILHLTQTVESE